jgi:putative transposase
MSDRRRQFDDLPYAHFITFCVDRRRRLLDHDQPKRIVLGVLNDELFTFNAKCAGFVLMPDHVHAIIWLPTSGQLSRFMHAWKRKSSFHIRNWQRVAAPNYFEGFGQGDRFWLPKYVPFEIHSQKKLEEKLQYMHYNPVRSGLVTRAVDWPWSSAPWYLEHRSVGVPISTLD